jgi:hypothetical protein
MQLKSTNTQEAHGCTITMNTAHVAEQLTGQLRKFPLREFNDNISHWMLNLFKLIFKAINDFLFIATSFTAVLPASPLTSSSHFTRAFQYSVWATGGRQL